MIPALVLIITLYGCARLFNDVMARVPAGFVTWRQRGAFLAVAIVSLVTAAVILWICWQVQMESIKPATPTAGDWPPPSSFPKF